MLFGCCGLISDYLPIKDMGYDYIELAGWEIAALADNAFEAFLGTYCDAGFPCLGFNSYCGANLRFVGPLYNPDDVREYAELLCARGARLGIRSIGIGAPAARKLPEHYPQENAKKQMMEFLRITCCAAAKYGINILLEAVHERMCDYLTRTREAYELVRELDIGNLRMILDFYHAQVMGEGQDELSEYMHMVEHLHVSTDLGDNRRGFLSESDIPLLRSYIAMVKGRGYVGSMSVEADREALPEKGAVNLAVFRKI